MILGTAYPLKDTSYFVSCYPTAIESIGLPRPTSTTFHQFKVESCINGAPYGLPHLFRFDLELVTLRAKEVTVFCTLIPVRS